jgi:hypothetical protein
VFSVVFGVLISKRQAPGIIGSNASKGRAMVTAQFNCGLSRDPSIGEYDNSGGIGRER